MEKIKNSITKMKNTINQNYTKQEQVLIAGFSTLGMLIKSTYCEVEITGILNKVIDFIFSIALWAGIIVTLAGVLTLIKAFMDSNSGQGTPGAINKALGLTVLGVVLLAAKSVLTLLGVPLTITI